MRKSLFATVAVAALLPASAMAQALWSGPEIGLQGGYAFDGSSGNFHCFSIGGNVCEGVGTDPVFHYHINPTGPVGGLHAGYNWQWGHTVVGIEGDAEFADDQGSVTNNVAGFGVKTKMDFDASVRAKIGYAFDNSMLLYGTGGVAFGDVKTSYRVSPFPGPPNPLVNAGSTQGVRVGGTIGAGLAYAITPNWSVSGEYRWTDLGDKNFNNPAFSISDKNAFSYSVVRLGITYRFAPPPPPPMAAPMPAAAPAPAPAMARTFLVFFDFDKYNLTPDARRVIEAAAQSYKATGSARIDVSGYTDLAGMQAYNLRLSQRRADAVAAYLEKQGVPKSALDVKWFGKEHPRVPTPDGVREPQNRRVEIVMP